MKNTKKIDLLNIKDYNIEREQYNYGYSEDEYETDEEY